MKTAEDGERSETFAPPAKELVVGRDTIDEDDSLGGLWLVISDVGIAIELRDLLDEAIELLILEKELVLMLKLAEEERCGYGRQLGRWLTLKLVVEAKAEDWTMAEVLVGLLRFAVDGINTGVVIENEILLSQASCHVEVRLFKSKRPLTSVQAVISFLQLRKKG
jgi:hypothetical protein